MSHVVKCKVLLKNKKSLSNAITQLQKDKVNIKDLGTRTHKLYSGNIKGRGIQLNKWKYPIVVDEETGELSYDNYNGHWGDITELDRLVQEYTVKTVSKQATLDGLVVAQAMQPNGDIKLTLTSFDQE